MLNGDSTKIRKTTAEGYFTAGGGVLTPEAANYNIALVRNGPGAFTGTLSNMTSHKGIDVSVEGDANASLSVGVSRTGDLTFELTTYEPTGNGPTPLDPATIYIRAWDTLTP